MKQINVNSDLQDYLSEEMKFYMSQKIINELIRKQNKETNNKDAMYNFQKIIRT